MSDLDDILPPSGNPPADDDSSPVIRLANTILAEAVRRGADVVHMDPLPEPERRLVVRFRIEGTLFHVMDVPRPVMPGLIARMKIMADLDIAERRLPQNGRLLVRIENAEATLAIATVPTVNGEALVLQRLDQPFEARERLDELGYPPEILALLKGALNRPGVVVFAGPTWSGRHTSLYASLGWLNTGDITIATAEAPVRKAVPGLRQLDMRDDIGLNFAAALRSFRYQDVNVIGLGDIVDFESTDLMFASAHRGARIVATIHTNTAAAAVARFLAMGIEPWVVADGLSLIIGQRLVRRVCVRCRVAEKHDPATLATLGLPQDAALFRHAGCDDCGKTGFKGRALVAEALLVDETVRAAIRANKPLPAGAVRNPMRQAALALAAQGITTVDEALLVTPAP